MSSRNVFINCPFDDGFFPLLKCLLFTIVYIDLEPRLAETTDSGQVRLHRIVELMKTSAFSIHDLSRAKPTRRGALPRFNMPFECGIDFGLRLSDEAAFGQKRFLILGESQHEYRKFLSDIAGHDIKAHNGKSEQMVKAVRDWFRVFMPAIPRHSEIWLAYNEFEDDYKLSLTSDGYDPESITALTFSDIVDFVKTWVASYKTAKKAA